MTDDPTAHSPTGRTFEFVQCLGRGSYGEVYLATMRSSDIVESKVAVKVLRKDVDPESQAVSRLRDEARLLGALNHPHILQIFDLIRLGGRVALITEYIPGEDLTDLVGEVPPRAALEIGSRIALALAAAWTTLGKNGQPLRLIHRDIKPSNIRVGQHGEVKLLDFGIAHSDSPDRESRTVTQTVIGSFDYMAPERMGQREVGTPADVYSLGCTLFEVLSGHGVFQDMTVRKHLVYAHSETRHQALIQSALEALPHREILSDLLGEMLHYDPEKRPHLEALEDRLETVATRLSSSALRSWSRARTWPPARDISAELVGTLLSESRPDTAFAMPIPSAPRRSAPLIAILIALGLLATAVALLLLFSEPRPEASVAPPAVAAPPATTPTTPSPLPPAIEAPIDAPDPEPVEPSTPPPPQSTRYWVSGPATTVFLVRDGQRFPPGEVPAGAYTIEATFPNTQMEMAEVGTVEIKTGETVEIKCRSGFFACSR
jgi:serine/threonine protein kinase